MRNVLTMNKKISIAISNLVQITIFVFLLSWSGCTYNTERKLNNNATVTDCFTREEIKDLTKLLDFFNEQICVLKSTEKKKVIECYDGFIERMSKTVETGSFEINISFEKQYEIYKQISDSVFNQIWVFGRSWSRSSPDTLKRIDYRVDGKYVKFLKELGNDYDMIKTYSMSLELAYSLSPSMIGEILMIKEEYQYDLTDIRLQLVVAIHYLTMNDQFERKEKYSPTSDTRTLFDKD